MENFTRENSSQLFSMEVDDQAKNTFLEMARWTKFLSVLGIIFLILIVLAGMGFAMVMSSMSAAYSSQLGIFSQIGAIGTTLYFIVIAALGLYPTYALFKYSTGIKIAIKTNSKEKFNQAIAYLKGVFKYYGIFMIILLGIYGLVIGIAALAALGR